MSQPLALADLTDCPGSVPGVTCQLTVPTTPLLGDLMFSSGLE